MKDQVRADGTDWALLAGFRFLMACIVLCGHINDNFLGSSPIVQLVAAFGQKAGVVGFFIISGYSIAASLERSQQHYYKRRFLRIYPMYIVALATAVLLENVLHGHVTLPKGSNLTALSPVSELGNIFFLQTFIVKPIVFDGPVWSLAVEVSYYLVAPFLIRFPKWVPLAIIAVSALSYSAPMHSDWGTAYFIFTRFNMLEWAWAWFIGYYLFKDSRPIFLVIFSILGVFLIRYNTFVNPEPYAAITFLASLLVIAWAEKGRSLRSASPQIERVFRWLGEISYPLYLMQFPIFVAAWGLLGISNANMVIILCVAGSIPAYYLADVYLKQRIEEFVVVPKVRTAS